jgi:molybdenum cofactor cytidylyltransferase
MRAQTVDVRESTGRILFCTVFRPGGQKLFAKGHVLSEEDVRLLETEGLSQVWVTGLEDGEVSEGDAVSNVATGMGRGCLEIRLAAAGRANLFAAEDCCVLVDDELLRQMNVTSSIVIATIVNFSFARAGQRIAAVKSAPFAVAQAHLEAVTSILRVRGPIVQGRPIRQPSVAVLYTDPVHGDRARQLFESVMRQRLERFGATVDFALAVPEDEGAVAHALQHLLRAHPTVILVASSTAPAGPEDVIGRALDRIEGRLDVFSRLSSRGVCSC